MKEQLKILLWNFPYIGIIYLFVSMYNIKLWISMHTNVSFTISGLIVQILSIGSIPFIIKLL